MMEGTDVKVQEPMVVAREERALVRAAGLSKRYRVSTRTGRRTLTAVDDVTLEIEPGRIVALVGESGCGKSTTGRLLLGLEQPTAGTVTIDGHDLAGLSAREMRAMRRQIQPVFQDPYDSMNGRMRVGAILAEPARVHNIEPLPGRTVPELLDLVDLSPDFADRFPFQLSGGQRQRVAIARALALSPRFMVLDEPVSALDVSVQAQIINLLRALQRELGLAYLFISHDLPLVRYLAQETVVMYLGRVVEQAPTATLFGRPRHPYTQLLLASVPRAKVGAERVDSHLALAAGDLPSPLDRPSGCVFSSRCPLATDRCRTQIPPLREVGEAGHAVACFYAETADIAAAR